MCAGFLDDTLQDLRVLQHRAWTEHVVIEWLVIMVSHEQRLFQDLENCILVNISIRVMNKYAWFCITVCINMEVVSSTCDTSSYESPSFWKSMVKIPGPCSILRISLTRFFT